MNKIDSTKLYGHIGKVLCGVAGAIVGFIFGGVSFAVAGFIVGGLAGYLLQKAMLKPAQ